MKIDINKDFEEAFPNEVYSGFTLGQCLAAVIGLIMAAGAAFLLWKFAGIPIVECTYMAIPLMIPACAIGFFRYQGQSLYGIIREFLFARKTQKLSYAAGEYSKAGRIFSMKRQEQKHDERKKHWRKKRKKKNGRKKDKNKNHRNKAVGSDERGDESWQ